MLTPEVYDDLLEKAWGLKMMPGLTKAREECNQAIEVRLKDLL